LHVGWEKATDELMFNGSGESNRYVETYRIVAASCQPSADIREDKTDTTTVDHLRRSAPVIRRFCPVFGWWTMLQLLARRGTESIAFSVPDRNAL
jgi:hypothetical protein